MNTAPSTAIATIERDAFPMYPEYALHAIATNALLMDLLRLSPSLMRDVAGIALCAHHRDHRGAVCQECQHTASVAMLSLATLDMSEEHSAALSKFIDVCIEGEVRR